MSRGPGRRSLVDHSRASDAYSLGIALLTSSVLWSMPSQLTSLRAMVLGMDLIVKWISNTLSSDGIEHQRLKRLVTERLSWTAGQFSALSGFRL